jgi:hypothetical protein
MADVPTKSERIAASRSALAERYAADPAAVPRFEARMANLSAVRRREREAGWIILRTDGRSTLRLADTLMAAGLATWTPRRTVKRVKQGRHHLIDGKPVTMEVDLPILPTFVFAAASDLVRLLGIAAQPFSPFPAFTVFRFGDRVPLIAPAEIAGLKGEERDAQAAIDRIRETEAREERRRLRAAAARTEHDRRRALRAERRTFKPGERVTVADWPALAGVAGTVEHGDDRTAFVVFGGLLRVQVETWQLVPDHVGNTRQAAE